MCGTGVKFASFRGLLIPMVENESILGWMTSMVENESILGWMTSIEAIVCVTIDFWIN
jgi:hypothetical protein